MKTRIERDGSDVHVIFCTDSITEAASLMSLLKDAEGVLRMSLVNLVVDRPAS